jgi:hypothetical protein
MPEPDPLREYERAVREKVEARQASQERRKGSLEWCEYCGHIIRMIDGRPVDVDEHGDPEDIEHDCEDMP